MLAQVEFAYNDSPNRSTGQSPFHIIYGMQPRGVCELRNLGEVELRSDKGEDFSSEIQAIHDRESNNYRTTTSNTRTKKI